MASMFYSGLKPAVKDEVHGRVQVDNHLLERELERREEDALRRRPTAFTPSSTSLFDPSRAVPPPRQPPVGPRIAATTAAPASRLSQADRDHRFNSGLCLYYHHSAGKLTAADPPNFVAPPGPPPDPPPEDLLNPPSALRLAPSPSPTPLVVSYTPSSIASIAPPLTTPNSPIAANLDSFASAASLKNPLLLLDHFLVPGSLIQTVKNALARCLVDCGTLGRLISPSFVAAHCFCQSLLPTPIDIFDVTNCPLDSIKSFVHAKLVLGDDPLNQHVEEVDLFVCNIGSVDLVLGLPWLAEHNFAVDWASRSVRFNHCPERCSSPSPTAPTVAGQPTPLDDSYASSSLRAPQPSPRPETPIALSSAAISIVTLEDFDADLPDAILSGSIAQISTPSIAATSAASPSTTPDDAALANTLDISLDQLLSIPPYLRDLAPVFSKRETEHLPPRRPYDLKIALKPDTRELEILHDWIQDSLAKGHIRPSSSAAASPILFAKKKDSSLRLCVDYRGLNDITVKNCAPLPRIDQLLDDTCSAKIFSKVDLRSAYNLLHVADDDVWKTVFRTPFGLYETLVMPFGLRNAPPVFQSFISDVLRSHVGPNGHVVVYLDDILVYSPDDSSHQQYVRTVLRDLLNAHLYAKIDKCDFGKSEVEFLGYLVGNRTVRMDPGKLDSIRDWPPPSSVKEIQRFLGFCNFYRRFIADFASHARNLTALTHKNTCFDMSPSLPAYASFLALRDTFLSTPVLSSFDPDRQITLFTDASKVEISAQLCQPDDTDQLHPVGFFPASTRPPRSTTRPMTRKCSPSSTASTPSAIGATAPRSPSSSRPTTRTSPSSAPNDASTLARRVGTRTSPNSTSRFTTSPARTIPPTPHPAAQTTLSASSPDDSLDSRDITLLSPDHFPSLPPTITALSFSIPNTYLLDDLRRAWEEDEELAHALSSPSHGFTLDNGLYLFRNRLYVPPPLRTRIVTQHHDTPAAGHRGYASM
ncbi:hypothetical protein JCM1840_001753 [Sporobolomyces johnsonii]